MNTKNRLYILILILLFSIDQLSKNAIKLLANSVQGYSMKIFGNFFRLTYVENHGGIFGILQGHIKLFTIVSSLLIIYVVVTEYKNFFKYKESTRIAILFIAAGALGNMTDRFFRGYVIDMMDFRTIWKFVFNVADMYIHIGIYIIVVAYLLEKAKEKFGGKVK